MIFKKAQLIACVLSLAGVFAVTEIDADRKLFE